MKSADILRTAIIAGVSLGILGLPGEAHSNTISQPRSSCLPGDHVLLDAPLFQGSDKFSPQIKTDGTPQLNIILGNSDGRVFVERSPDSKSKDFAQPGFLDVTQNLDAACKNYQANELANRSRGLQPTNDVWSDRVVQVKSQGADGSNVYVTSRIDEVVDDNFITVQQVDEVTGKVITKTVARNSLYMEPLASTENPYILPGKP